MLYSTLATSIESFEINQAIYYNAIYFILQSRMNYKNNILFTFENHFQVSREFTSSDSMIINLKFYHFFNSLTFCFILK